MSWQWQPVGGQPWPVPARQLQSSPGAAESLWRGGPVTSTAAAVLPSMQDETGGSVSDETGSALS